MRVHLFWKVLFLALLLSILALLNFGQTAFAAEHQYFSGQRTYGQLGISNYVNLTGGKTQTAICFPSYRAHNATQITPTYKLQATGAGCYVELHHGMQINKRNHCWWSAVNYVSGSEQITCHYFD